MPNRFDRPVTPPPRPQFGLPEPANITRDKAIADLCAAAADILRGELPEAIAEALRAWTKHADG